MADSRFRITNPRLGVTKDGSQELSAEIAGERCWFRVPGEWPLEKRGETFAVAGTLLAMRAGIPLELPDDLPVCPVLLQNLQQVQQIFRLWGPSFGLSLTPVAIHAATAPAPPGRGTAVFFSGGVDGTYTLLEAPVRIAHAVFVRGVDFQLDNPIYDESFARNQAWLARRSIPLLEMSSNLRWVARHHGIGWRVFFGAGLAAFAHAFGFSRTFIGSGHSWKDLLVEGSHPASDHLWSSETRIMEHHGREAMRWEKVERIAAEEGAIDILRVCWQDKGFNCGRCEKCIRTMVTLRLLGITSPNFPPLADLGLVSRFMPGDVGEAVFIEESIALAKERDDPELRRALERSLRRWRLRRLAVDADTALLGGMLRRLKRRFGRGE